MKLKKIILLTTSVFLLAGCNNNSNVDSGDTNKENNNDDSGEVIPTPVTNEWPTALKSLMLEWCGEVLPYISLGSGLSYKVDEDYYGDEYLFIYDEATTSKIDNYDTKLEGAGWSVNYDDDEEWYVAEKTSLDGLNIYQIGYYFDEDYGYGNSFQCYCSTLSNEKDTSSQWNDTAKEIMNEIIGELLPFVNLGKDYTISYEDNTFQIADNYYQSLQDDVVSVLTSNGYINTGVDDYGDPLLVKTLADTSTITVNPYYSYGNVIDVTYSPYINKTTSWPSDVLKEIEGDSGYTVPEFTATSYEYYKVGSKVVLSASVSEDLEETYLESCLDAGFTGSSTSVSTFEETLSISFAATGDYDSLYNFVAKGFTLTAQKTTPTSDFYDNWPEDVVKKYLSENEIDVSDVSNLKIDNNSGKKYKVNIINEENIDTIYEYLYEYYYFYIVLGSLTEEDIIEMAYEYIGLYIEIYDSDESMASSYYSQLSNIPYYVEDIDDYGTYYAEDASGALGLCYYSSSAVFSLQIITGSGKTHEEQFILSKDSMSVVKGQEVQLTLTKSMLVGDVTWTSSNTDVASVSENGKVTINSEAETGSAATITVTLNTDSSYTASCVFIVVDKSFGRITSLNELVSGSRYLIVCEDADVAFNSVTTSIDSSANAMSITASNGKIDYDEDLESVTFTITEGSGTNAGKYSICTSNGEYINQSGQNSKKIAASSTISYHNISFSGNNVKIEGAYGGFYIMYNSSWNGFRYYKSGQTDIQLYRLYE